MKTKPDPVGFSEFVERQFQPGKYVMLQTNICTDSGIHPHPDAGRVGKIISVNKKRFVVEFLVGAHASSFSLIHRDAYLPMLDEHVEKYTKGSVTGYRVNDQFKDIAKKLDWDYNQRSEGIL